MRDVVLSAQDSFSLLHLASMRIERAAASKWVERLDNQRMRQVIAKCLSLWIFATAIARNAFFHLGQCRGAQWA